VTVRSRFEGSALTSLHWCWLQLEIRSCLPLVLSGQLLFGGCWRGRELPTQLRIGVRKDQGKLAAHAWVEYQGHAIGEPEASHLHYAAFAEEIRGELP